MRVFLSGATGHVGGAVAERLASLGHDVFGLTRDAQHAALLATGGVHPVLGDLADPDSFLAELKNSDAAVHAARGGSDPARLDQRALEAVRQGAQDGRVRRFVYTSSVWVLGDTGGRIVDESAPLVPCEAARWRPAHEEVALDLGVHEVEVVILRPAFVYGGTRGIFAGWFREGRERGTVTYPGDGSQHWNLVHRDDLADAFRLALEGGTGGERYLVSDETHFTVRELAETVARVTRARAVPRSREEVRRSEGPWGEALLMDQLVTSARARRELGWTPAHTSCVDEMDALHRDWLTGERAPVG